MLCNGLGDRTRTCMVSAPNRVDFHYPTPRYTQKLLVDPDGNPPSLSRCKRDVLVQHLGPILLVETIGTAPILANCESAVPLSTPSPHNGVTGGTCTHLAGATDQRTTACATVTFDPQFLSEEMWRSYIPHPPSRSIVFLQCFVCPV